MIMWLNHKNQTNHSSDKFYTIMTISFSFYKKHFANLQGNNFIQHFK
jgi:hypothetical protein